jgi:23S rRNA pseudouridine2605 synthase
MSGKSNEHSGERIAKVMARAGMTSRRQAELWIAAGRVAVNGATIASPALNVTPADKITVDGQPLRQRERTRLFLYNKIRGLVTTNSDPQGRPTIFAALPKHLPRLISIGRLDLSTEGLLLLTNDGALARVLELPKTGWLRRYRVRALGRVTQDALDGLHRGVTVDGIRYGPVEATLDREQGANVWLTLGIREGKNREVRNVLEHLGLKVNRLIRIAFGPFQLGDLESGAVMEVPAAELRAQLGDSIVREAGVDFEGPVLDHAAAAADPGLRRDRQSKDRKPAKGGQRGRQPQRGTERTAHPGRDRHPSQFDESKLPRRPTSKKKLRRDRASGPRPSRPKSPPGEKP